MIVCLYRDALRCYLSTRKTCSTFSRGNDSLLPRTTLSHTVSISDTLTSQNGNPETQRQATQHACLPSLVGDGNRDTGWELIKWNSVGDVMNILYRADKSSQGMTKIYCTGTTSPKNNQRKDPLHLYSLSPHASQFQQSAGATPESLWPNQIGCVAELVGRPAFTGNMKKTIQKPSRHQKNIGNLWPSTG